MVESSPKRSPHSPVREGFPHTVARKLATCARAFDLPVIPTTWVSLHMEAAGSPKFSGYPYDYMPWPQTLVVSRAHHLSVP